MIPPTYRSNRWDDVRLDEEFPITTFDKLSQGEYFRFLADPLQVEPTLYDQDNDISMDGIFIKIAPNVARRIRSSYTREVKDMQWITPVSVKHRTVKSRRRLLTWWSSSP